MSQDKKPRGGAVVRGLIYFSQLSLTLVVPIVVCAWIFYWLRQHFSWPNWTVVAGILLGTAAGAVSLYRFVVRQIDRDERHKDG